MAPTNQSTSTARRAATPGLPASLRRSPSEGQQRL
jgi:hypothetical protein